MAETISTADLFKDTVSTEDLFGSEATRTFTPDKPKTYIEEVGSALRAGGGFTLESVGGTLEMIGAEGGKELKQKGFEISQREENLRPRYLEEGNILQHPERAIDPIWWTRMLGENAPAMLTMMLPGGAFGTLAKTVGSGVKAVKASAMVGAFSGAFTVEAGAQYNGAKKEMERDGKLDPVEIEKIATIEGVSVGITNAVLEILPFGRLLKRIPNSEKTLLNAVKRTIKQGGSEGGTEALQEVVSMLAEKVGHAPDLSIMSVEGIGRIVESFMAGFGLGGVMGGGKESINQATRLKDAIQERKKTNDDVKARLKEKGASEEEIQIVDENMSDFEKQLFLMEDNVEVIKQKAQEEVIEPVEQVDPLTEEASTGETKAQEPKIDTAETIKDIKKEKGIPKITKLELIEGLRTAETPEQIQKIIDQLTVEKMITQKKTALKGFIKEKKFERVENLRKALKFPSIKKMTIEEVQKFAEILRPFQEGDRFLTERQIETVDKTDLKGIKTLREAREKLSEELNVPVENLENIKVSELDRLRYDTALARKNPVYKMLVEEYHREILISEAKYLEIEEVINDLTNKARKSRKQSLLDRAIPTDKVVFEYLESDNKAEVAKKMTLEELKLAERLQEQYAEALEYLIKTKALKTGRENYITNIRRGFIEAWKESDFKTAIKETLDTYKLDEQVFDILDQKTGNILPLEKFFQFAMKRTGGIKPTQNVAKASTTYFKTLEKKKALDSFMPKMMIYVDVITPKKETPRGLEADQKLKTFVKEWINTKKGRPIKLLIKPGGRIDLMTRAMKAYVTTMDLGFNVHVGLSSTVGETVATYVSLGKKNMAKGVLRMNTKQGKKIIKEHKNYVGKSVWEQLSEPSQNLNDKVATAMFGFFTSSARRSNKMFLLGSLTKEEFDSGNISEKRLSELKVEMGRWRVIAGSKSIAGSTTEGVLWTHYKSWAIPILSSTSSNIVKLTKSIASKEARGELTGKELIELGRVVEVTGAALIVIAMIPDYDDDSFVGKLKSKVIREALTILGALDPSLWTATPRLVQWGGEIGKVLKDLATLEGEKVVKKTKSLATPRAVKQFLDNDNNGDFE